MYICKMNKRRIGTRASEKNSLMTTCILGSDEWLGVTLHLVFVVSALSSLHFGKTCLWILALSCILLALSIRTMTVYSVCCLQQSGCGKPSLNVALCLVMCTVNMLYISFAGIFCNLCSHLQLLYHMSMCIHHLLVRRTLPALTDFIVVVDVPTCTLYM